MMITERLSESNDHTRNDQNFKLYKICRVSFGFENIAVSAGQTP